jgi:hypothetical protein
MPYRLGDDVDDYCIKCKRITNHSIVSLVEEEPAKVRCRTCYNDHDYRRCEIPPSKKDLKKMALLSEALASGGPADAPADGATVAEAADSGAAAEGASVEAPSQDGRTAKPKKATRKAKA